MLGDISFCNTKRLTTENWLATTNCLTTTDVTGTNIGDTGKEETKVTGCTTIGDGKDLFF